MSSFETPPPVGNAAELHQDWDPPFTSLTVMLGFPPSDHFEGVGVLPELVALSHELRMEEMQSERFPLPAGRVTPADVGAAEGRRPTASACARSCA